MRNYKIAAAAAAVMVLTLGMTAFAAEWKQEADGRWWYLQDDGSYPAGRWMEINGKQYYFDADGYMLSDTTTPDGYKVGADGAWIENETDTGNNSAGNQASENTQVDSSKLNGTWYALGYYDSSDLKFHQVPTDFMKFTFMNGIVMGSSAYLSNNAYAVITEDITAYSKATHAKGEYDYYAVYRDQSQNVYALWTKQGIKFMHFMTDLDHVYVLCQY